MKMRGWKFDVPDQHISHQASPITNTLGRFETIHHAGRYMRLLIVRGVGFG